MFSMKHLLMGVYQVCANKSPWVKLALQRWGGGGWGAYIQVSDLRAIMALLFLFDRYFISGILYIAHCLHVSVCFFPQNLPSHIGLSSCKNAKISTEICRKNHNSHQQFDFKLFIHEIIFFCLQMLHQPR